MRLQVVISLLRKPEKLKIDCFSPKRKLSFITYSLSCNFWTFFFQVSDDISEGILDDIEVNVTSVGLVVRHPGYEYSGLINGVDHAALYDTISLLRKVKGQIDINGMSEQLGEQTKDYIEKVCHIVLCEFLLSCRMSSDRLFQFLIP